MNEKKVLLGIGGGALALSAGLGWFLYKTMDDMDQVEQKIEEKRKDIATARTKVDEVKKLEDRVIVLRESVAALASVLPTQQEVEDFVKTISVLGKDVRITEARPKARASSGRNQSKVFENIGYSLKVDAKLWNFMDFMNRIESHKRFVMIPRMKMSLATTSRNEGSEKDKGPITEPMHTVEFEMETFAYNPAKGGVPEPIPGYEKRRELLREEIEQAKLTIEQPAIDWKGAKGRRDVFFDPRMPEQGADPNGLTPEQQVELLGKLRTRVEEVVAIFTELKESTNFLRRFELREMIGEKMQSLEADVTAAEKQSAFRLPQTIRPFRIDVVDPLGKIKKELANHPGEQGPSPKELADVLVRARDMVRGAQIKESIEYMKPVLEKAASLEKDPVRAPYVAELRKLDREAKVAQKFEEKKVALGGLIVDATRKVAVVNNRTVEPGDPIDDELSVADISEDGVTFLLDEVQVTKKW